MNYALGYRHVLGTGVKVDLLLHWQLRRASAEASFALAERAVEGVQAMDMLHYFSSATESGDEENFTSRGRGVPRSLCAGRDTRRSARIRSPFGAKPVAEQPQKQH